MGIDIHLASGFVLRDAAARLQAKYRLWPWEQYDGVPVAHPSRVTDADIDCTYRLGSRTPRYSYVDLVGKHGKAISKYLRAIPLDRALEDDHLDLARLRPTLVDLFNLMTSVPRIKLAAATKLLHRHRPGILAVIDSVVADYYWFATSIRDEAAFRRLERADSLGERIATYLELLREDVRGARRQIDRARAACAGFPFAHASRVRIVESLIWHYYAGGPTESGPRLPAAGA
jgi:hypothetical protein